MPGFKRTAFDDRMDELAAAVDGKTFFGRVAGPDRLNDDGSSRQAAIANLIQGDELVLVPEPDNAFDKNAVKVLAPSGVQIGYLEQRLAGETVRRSAKGTDTRAFFSNHTGAVTQTRGAVILLLTYKRVA